MSYEIDEREKLLLEGILNSSTIFIKVFNLIESQYFQQPLDKVVEFVQSYYEEYKNVPSAKILKAEFDIVFEEYDDLPLDEVEWISDEIEKHCRNAAMRKFILRSAELLSDDDVDPDYGSLDMQMRDIATMSIQRNIGIEYFTDPLERLRMMEENIDSRSCGYPELDLIMDKIRRGESVMFAGGSASGKSVVLSNIARNLLHDMLNVVYISLELKEELVSKRFDSIITDIDSKKIFEEKEQVNEILNELKTEYGNLVVKKMRQGTTSNQIRSYLMEYQLTYNKIPDVICVDYLDLIGTNSNLKGTDVFDRDKQKSEELRDVFEEYNAYGFTASQLNRDAVDTERKSQAHIAGGISKINTCDVGIAIIRNEEQQETGEIHFQALKLRNSIMSPEPAILFWDDDTLEITNSPKKRKRNKQATSKSREKLNSAIGRSSQT